MLLGCGDGYRRFTFAPLDIRILAIGGESISSDVVVPLTPSYPLEKLSSSVRKVEDL